MALVLGLALGAAVLAMLAWWLLVETEGVYLGRRVVVWLYDLYAGRYDQIKEYQPEYEHVLLARPIMGAVAPHRSPLVLDVATGTGRLPLALLNHVSFQGRVIAADLSRRMLAQAAERLAEDADQVDLLWCPAEELPFRHDTFDVVTCLESLEFMSDQPRVIAELARVLRPGGLLLITNRINTRWMPGKLISEENLHGLLETADITHVVIEPWQEDYHRVWGRKASVAPVTGARQLVEVLRCPCCAGDFVNDGAASLRCAGCSLCVTIGCDGVVELFPHYSANQ
jgi:ubiquinone/menaquinone biosynthesis C-methylase UbiE